MFRRPVRSRRNQANGPPASPAAYSPIDEGTTVLWIDPRDAGTYTLDGSNNFTDLKNKISGVSLTITSDPNRDPAAINGTAGITLDNTDWFMGTEAAVVAAGQNQADFTIFTVLSGGADAAKSYFGWGDSGAAANNTKVLICSSAAGGRWGYFAQNNAAAFVNQQDTVDLTTGPQILMWRCNAGTIDFKIGNVARTLSGTTTVAGTVAPNRFTLGVNPGSGLTQAWGANFGDHLVYSSALSDAACTRVYNYLSPKYGGI